MSGSGQNSDRWSASAVVAAPSSKTLAWAGVRKCHSNEVAGGLYAAGHDG
jgi:hypothetical protein